MKPEQAAFEASPPASMRAATGEEPLPKPFGPYTLLTRLSKGAMAEIFLALQRSAVGFEKIVVVKRLLPAMNQDRTFIDLLLHEARVAAALTHPAIAQTFDAGQIDGAYFIAMEPVHGEDVRTLLHATKQRGGAEIPLEHALTIMLGVCSGLSYMHEKRDLSGIPLGVAHRDISAHTIVVSFTADVKIIGLGLPKGEDEEALRPKDQERTGNVPYMSPEQVMGDVIDARTDIFAAGVVLYEMTTGQKLFQGKSDVETLLMIRDAAYTRPSETKPGYPLALERILARALQKRREDRYPSAREMQADLERFVREERIPVSTAGLAAWMETLFPDKIARHQEALRRVKQLVLELAFAGPATSTSAASVHTRALGASRLGPSRGSRFAAVISAAFAIALGLLYVQSQRSARQAEIIKLYREEQALRQQAAPAPAPREATGTLSIASEPAGCAIWLDGALRPEVTPARLEKLPLGRELRVEVTREGLDAYRKSVKLSEEAPGQEIKVELQVLPAAVVSPGKPR